MIATFNSQTKEINMVNRHLLFIHNMVLLYLIIIMDVGLIHMLNGMVDSNNINKKKNHPKKIIMFLALLKDMRLVSKKILMLSQNLKFI